MDRCPKCAAAIESPLGCTACGTLFELARDPSPFEIFGLAPSFEVDAGELRRKLLKLGRITHPDFFATQSAAMKALAEHASALLNEAYEVLSDDARRADWLVRELGGPDENELREMPKPFLMEVLEWNEKLEAARSSEPHDSQHIGAELEALETELRGQRGDTIQSLRRALEPLPERQSERLRAARQQLNALRYIDRALGEIEALRLAHPAER
jgi:molecular chaperone HscB